MMMMMIEHVVESLDCDFFSSSVRDSYFFFPFYTMIVSWTKEKREEMMAAGLIAHLIMS